MLVIHTLLEIYLYILLPYIISLTYTRFVKVVNVYTGKRVDEVVRHLHRVTQDQFSLVSEKVSGIPEDNNTMNMKIFRQTLTCIELLRYKRISNVELFR